MKIYSYWGKKTLFWFLVATLILLVVYFFFGPIGFDGGYARSFDSELWKSAEGIHDTDNPIRLQMIDDFLGHYQLVGMSRSEIDALLGVPQPTGYFKNYDYVYWLGPERSAFGIDSEWLGIMFSNNAVAQVQILKD